ncbi:MAG: helix-turn-helix domain-containing protein [Proteobacteria bacterium]|nr:helix-turn-helix domain-containing protein [Pseudomonadota bacterium]
MSSKISLQRNELSSEKVMLYKSLGSLSKAYRQWRKMSQEVFAESIKISVRELQNWEANRRRAQIENLHDIAEFTGIPMQVLIALNADQPVWYSLRKRLFMYSSIEEAQFSSHELFRHRETSDDNNLLKKVSITKDKHIEMILSCHQDLYGSKKPLESSIIKAAISIVPNLSNMIFDSWNHFVGHQICLPIKLEAYQALKKQKTIENYLTREMISDITTLDEGVFFYYSTFGANLSAASRLIIVGARSLSDIKQKDGYLIASHTITKEAATVQENAGMKFVGNYECMLDNLHSTIYEIGLKYYLRPNGPVGWIIDQFKEEVLVKKKKKQNQKKMSPVLSAQDQDKSSHPGKNFTPANMSEKNNHAIVDKFVTIVDENKRKIQDGKTQYINLTMVACKNPKCTLYGKTEKGNIVFNGTYRTKQGSPGRRFLCKKCSKSFCHRTGTIFYDLRSPEEKVIKSLSLLLKGMPLQGVADSLGTTNSTVRRWLGIATRQSKKLDALLIKEYNVSPIELAALWTFVKTNSLRPRAFQSRAKNKSYSTTK